MSMTCERTDCINPAVWELYYDVQYPDNAKAYLCDECAGIDAPINLQYDNGGMSMMTSPHLFKRERMRTVHIEAECDVP